uniref:Si:ch73-329n5.2 n=1 Tax=Myripristis murdjan TaxID=586833 RepID=A0A668AZ10_9TELE
DITPVLNALHCSSLIALRRPFVYFGRQYNQIYVNNNGHLTFDAAWGRFVPYRFPGNASRDLIAPFWTDLDNRQNGQVLYNQYTTGSVLQRATQDINTYFPDLNFVANWVFVATWYEVAYYSTSGTRTTFQAVLISGGQYSFVLMNYGTIFLKIFFGCWYDVETYETCILIGSFVVTYILSFPGSFYPVSGTANGRIDDGSSSLIVLQRPFVYFGRQYNQIYVNNNGHLTFDAAWHRYVPYRFPGNASRDLIAPFWTDLDNRQNGQVLYNQYTSGSVLQRATQDINTYFPNLNFVANWIFVATWYEVAYFPTSGTVSQLNPYSFVLMNYGTIAQTSRSVQVRIKKHI